MIREINGLRIELTENGTIMLSDQFGTVGINMEDYNAFEEIWKKAKERHRKKQSKKERRKNESKRSL